MATPPSEPELLMILESDGAYFIVTMTLIMLAVINCIGFYALMDHANKVWLQIEFIQCFSLLALLSKNEGVISSADNGFLVDLGYFTRLDFVSNIVPKDLTREGLNRFDLYSYV